jgi:hypothetical protein
MSRRGFPAILFLVACEVEITPGTPGGSASNDDPTFLQTTDINQTTLFHTVDFHCDGEQSLLDWLVVFQVQTPSHVVYVDVEVFQRGTGFGAIALEESRSGDWYADIWEDDYGIDCERDTQGVTFYAEDSAGNVEILDL